MFYGRSLFDQKTATTAAKRKDRIIGVDAARGLALIGMMAIHILPGWNEDGEPTFAWQLLSGTSAALFAFLAGISLAFVSGGARAVGGRTLTAAKASLAVRALIIAGIGLLIGLLDPPAAIILAYYGMMFLLAIPLLGLSPRMLGFAAVGFAILGPILMQALRRPLPDLEGYDPSLSLLFSDPGGVVSALLFTGSFPAVPYMAYICAGLAIGRMNLRLRDVQKRLVIGGAILAVATWLFALLMLEPMGGREALVGSSPRLGAEGVEEVLIWGPEIGLPTSSGWWLTVLSPYSSTPVEILNTLGVAAVVLGLMLWVGSKVMWIITPLATAGAMTLTLYSVHLVVLATGFLAQQPRLSLAIQIAAAVLFAVLWRNVTGRTQGPLERVVAQASDRTRRRILASAGTVSPNPEHKP
ncbi:DUF1624 domain-containing protein [Arthrobacter sp. VKM Ac-2550]|uniref:DUF1624 domain-containing protein n=1 Tax=Crystallibacter permensis TaxID=1938888 RepID=UPI002227984B|nr:DUF1624 domain-containing protein [Arthrobacter sp. VKM Ac-2550]MCW2131468.1 Protein of unknown function (DUF1624) [Arthrobacter sp. VKM Ac-2550]